MRRSPGHIPPWNERAWVTAPGYQMTRLGHHPSWTCVQSIQLILTQIFRHWNCKCQTMKAVESESKTKRVLQEAKYCSGKILDTAAGWGCRSWALGARLCPPSHSAPRPPWAVALQEPDWPGEQRRPREVEPWAQPIHAAGGRSVLSLHLAPDSFSVVGK